MFYLFFEKGPEISNLFVPRAKISNSIFSRAKTKNLFFTHREYIIYVTNNARINYLFKLYLSKSNSSVQSKAWLYNAKRIFVLEISVFKHNIQNEHLF